MKTRWLGAMGSLGVVAFFTGCAEPHHAYVVAPPPPGVSAQVVVTEPPPPLRHEVRVVAPGPNYVWAPGYWTWDHRWVWVEGRWVAPPGRHAHWHPGYWRRHGDHYVWVEGRWS